MIPARRSTKHPSKQANKQISKQTSKQATFVAREAAAVDGDRAVIGQPHRPPIAVRRVTQIGAVVGRHRALEAVHAAPKFSSVVAVETRAAEGQVRGGIHIENQAAGWRSCYSVAVATRVPSFSSIVDVPSKAYITNHGPRDTDWTQHINSRNTRRQTRQFSAERLMSRNKNTLTPTSNEWQQRKKVLLCRPYLPGFVTPDTVVNPTSQ